MEREEEQGEQKPGQEITQYVWGTVGHPCGLRGVEGKVGLEERKDLGSHPLPPMRGSSHLGIPALPGVLSAPQILGLVWENS